MSRKTSTPSMSAPSALLLVIAALFPMASHATDISDAPLASSTASQVKPNLLFVLDDSGSMRRNYMPDGVGSRSGSVGFRNHLCNYVYYNPSIDYQVPLDSTGTELNSSDPASFTSAYGEAQGVGDSSNEITGTGYYAYRGQAAIRTNLTNGYLVGDDASARAAYYWTYVGSGTPAPLSSACNMTHPSGTTVTGLCSDGTSVTNSPPSCTAPATLQWKRITVSSTSGPGATDERLNFANWYSYYRTRMMMMKSASGRAFLNVSDNYRVGFMTIHPGTFDSNGDANGSNVSASKFLKVADFGTAHRSNWYTKLYANDGSSATPLRTALSVAGRYFAGKNDQINKGMISVQADDPVQYSCQHNFTILTTDGYWNDGDGKQINGTSDMDNQDGNIVELDAYNPAGKKWLMSPRPIYDGSISTVTSTDKSNFYRYATCTYNQRRTYQTTKSTLQNLQSSTQNLRTSTQDLQTTTQDIRSTQQILKTTVTATEATTNIIIRTVNSGSSLSQLRINGTNRLGATISASGSTSGARKNSIADGIVNNLTGNFVPLASGTCTSAGNPAGCTSNSDRYVTIRAPIGSGNVNWAVAFTTGGTITLAAANFSGGGTTTVGPSPASSCTAGTTFSDPSTITTSCTTTTTGPTVVQTCTPAAASAGNSWTATTCSANITGPTPVQTCTPIAETAGNNWTATTCSSAVSTVPVQTCTADPESAANNWTATTCSVSTTTNVPVQTCTPATASAANSWMNITCGSNTTGPTLVASCTNSAAAAGNSWTATSCAVTNDSGFQWVASCTPEAAAAGNSFTTTACQTQANGQRTQYQTTTTTTTTQFSGSTMVGSPTVNQVTDASFTNLDTVCYDAANLPALPSPNPQRPTGGTPPLPTAPCTAWPCETTSIGAASSNSLADVAQYYYKNDLRAAGAIGALGIDVSENNVQPSDTSNEGDRANWQHMTTFTMGLGISGSLPFNDEYKTSTSGTFQNIRDGITNWPTPSADQPTALDDLWHAAVNGRGQYFSARDPDTVIEGLQKAIAGIEAMTSSAAAAATSNLEPVAGDNFAYTAKYRTQVWTGELEAHEIDTNTGIVNSNVIWSAQAKLNQLTAAACDNRTIKLFRSGATDNLVDFKWNSDTCTSGTPSGSPTTSLNATEQAYFGAAAVAQLSQFPTMTDGSGTTVDQRTAAAGANLVNFLRGQRGKEGFEPNDLAKLYRGREHVLGDIVNAQPVFVKAPFANYDEGTDPGYTTFKTNNASRTPMVYVAANDGMLHAFYAGTSISDTNGGVEAWAFIPSLVLPNMHKLASANYASAHRFFVDGTPSVGDVFDTTSSTWKTILVGGLNKGGQGYYALDITNPATPKALWEFTDSDLGYSFGNPVITKVGGTWAVLVTSGHNNASDGKGYLYVLNAMTGAVIYKISTNTGTVADPSGLSKISVWVNDPLRNNSAVRVYGVDLKGNVWRFDVNDTIAPSGREATLLTTLVDPSGNPQPITTRPELTEIANEPYVVIGTGRYLGDTDRTDTQVQSIWVVKDPLTSGVANPRTTLKKQAITNVGSGLAAVRTVSCAAQCTSTLGWFVDLPDSGERINVDIKLQLGTLVAASNVPGNDACTVGGYSWLNFFNVATGNAVATSAGGLVGQRLSESLAVGLNIVRLPQGKTVVIATTSAAEQKTVEAPFDVPPPSGRRVSWREVIQ